MLISFEINLVQKTAAPKSRVSDISDKSNVSICFASFDFCHHNLKNDFKSIFLKQFNHIILILGNNISHENYLNSKFLQFELRDNCSNHFETFLPVWH